MLTEIGFCACACFYFYIFYIFYLDLNDSRMLTLQLPVTWSNKFAAGDWETFRLLFIMSLYVHIDHKDY